MAKGLSSGYLPIGAVAFSESLLKPFFDKGGEFYHGMTYDGHPLRQRSPSRTSKSLRTRSWWTAWRNWPLISTPC
jgi:adenosylmethionine-8-amino-7-oxononanoate aminotransferase